MRFEYYLSRVIKRLQLRAIKNSKIDKSSSVGFGSTFVDSEMARHSFCGYDCTIVNCTIGSFCSIASGCEIGGASHTIDWVSTSPVFNKNKDQIKAKFAFHEFNPTSKKTTVGNDVWIGSKVIVKAGVSIGDGAVVGMGSVVTKNIPPYEIWAGNPARKIKSRFNEETISKLLKIKWWTFKEEELRAFGNYFNDVNEFIKKVEGDR